MIECATRHCLALLFNVDENLANLAENPRTRIMTTYKTINTDDEDQRALFTPINGMLINFGHPNLGIIGHRLQNTVDDGIKNNKIMQII